MPAVLLYFRLHQPFRLRKYTVFDTDPVYFDAKLNPALLRRAAETAYLPLLRLCTALLHPAISDPNAPPPPPFKVAFSITGLLVEQLERHAPEVLHLLHTLAQSPHVEFLGETYHHSLASQRSPAEFIEQVNLHRDMLKRNFNIVPTTFRNTELIYANEVARLAADLGFPVILAEGYEPALDHRSAAFAYSAQFPPARPLTPEIPAPATPTLLLRNHQLSEALALHLADPSHPLFPLTPDALAAHIATIGGPLCNLFLPAEALSTEPTLLELLTDLPAALARHHCPFLLPREAPAHATNAGPLDLPTPTSWLSPDITPPLSPWLGNAMQQNAADELYKLEAPLKEHPDPHLLSDWRKLTTSDHLAYMSTHEAASNIPADPATAGATPYESPYDAYINFMNILDNLRLRAE